MEMLEAIASEADRAKIRFLAASTQILSTVVTAPIESLVDMDPTGLAATKETTMSTEDGGTTRFMVG